MNRESEYVRMKPFLVCIHDATPAFACETQALLSQLAPKLGRRISIGVVPDWFGEWPLAAHPEYCRLVQESAEELLLHGYCHRRHRGWGPLSWLTAGSDEMNGLSPEETQRLLERGQRALIDAFGKPARGFLAPAWQLGQLRSNRNGLGLEYALGYFSLSSATQRIPLATWTWDCGRWGWLGHVGHAFGKLLHSLGSRVPVLAIHPRDLERGFGPQIIRVTKQLLAEGYTPMTVTELLETHEC